MAWLLDDAPGEPWYASDAVCVHDGSGRANLTRRALALFLEDPRVLGPTGSDVAEQTTIACCCPTEDEMGADGVAAVDSTDVVKFRPWQDLMATLKEHEVVALALNSSSEMAVCTLGVMQHHVVVPIDTDLSTLQFVEVLSDIQPTAIVCSPDLVQRFQTIASQHSVTLSFLTTLVSLHPSATTTGLFHTHTQPLIRPELVSDESSPCVSLPAPPLSADACLLLRTSGTTAASKTVVLTRTSLRTGSAMVCRSLGLTCKDRGLNVLPLFHMHGLAINVLVALFSGGSCFYMPPFSSPEHILATIATHRLTWYSAVPAIHHDISRYIRNLAAPMPPVASLRFIRNCSAHLCPSLARQLAQQLNCRVVTTYAMTECLPICSNETDSATLSVDTVGPPGGPTVYIMPPNATSSADLHRRPNEIGEVVVKGPCMSQYRSPADNERCFLDGFLKTGDVGAFTEQGHVRLVGRLKELINRGGEKLHPQFIDATLQSALLPVVPRHIMTFATQHATLGEVPAVALVFDPCDSTLSGEQLLSVLIALRRAVAEHLGARSQPQCLVAVHSVPIGPTTKLQRIGYSRELHLPTLEGSGLAVYRCDGVLDSQGKCALCTVRRSNGIFRSKALSVTTHGDGDGDGGCDRINVACADTCTSIDSSRTLSDPAWFAAVIEDEHNDRVEDGDAVQCSSTVPPIDETEHGVQQETKDQPTEPHFESQQSKTHPTTSFTNARTVLTCVATHDPLLALKQKKQSQAPGHARHGSTTDAGIVMEEVSAAARTSDVTCEMDTIQNCILSSLKCVLGFEPSGHQLTAHLSNLGVDSLTMVVLSEMCCVAFSGLPAPFNRLSVDTDEILDFPSVHQLTDILLTKLHATEQHASDVNDATEPCFETSTSVSSMVQEMHVHTRTLHRETQEGAGTQCKRKAKRRATKRESAFNADHGLYAARVGDLNRLRELCASGWDPHHTVDKHGLTSLQWAAGQNHLDCTHFLVEDQHVDPNTTSKEGRTALHWACRNGHIQITKYLLENGADATISTKKGVSCLHWAVWGKSIPMVEYLLDHVKFKIDTLSNAGCNAAIWGSASGDLALCKALHARGANFKLLNSWGHGCVAKASWHGHNELLVWLLDTLQLHQQLFNVNPVGEIPVELAQQANKTETVELLLSYMDRHRRPFQPATLHIKEIHPHKKIDYSRDV
eukprot:m.181856 g.181856  ORF g.181856 m.181856 type:complete len:1185 (-) comp14664_c0_seq2:244-3798(-)